MAATAKGDEAAFNIAGSFEGDSDEHKHRGNKNGWKRPACPGLSSRCQTRTVGPECRFHTPFRRLVCDTGRPLYSEPDSWDAAVELKPEDWEMDEGVRFPLCEPAASTRLFSRAELRAVAVRPLDVPTRFADFDDYWTPFLGGQFPAPNYAMALSEADRAALRERIRATLPINADGSIDLMARAWAVRGTA